MSLLETAAADLRAILGDTAAGFSVPITVTDPDGVTATLAGLQTDIGSVVDSDTGVAVAGRKASVALSIVDLATAGLEVPRNVAKRGGKPWVVTFTPPNGTAQTMKVSEAMPDKLGIVTCILEAYTP